MLGGCVTLPSAIDERAALDASNCFGRQVDQQLARGGRDFAQAARAMAGVVRLPNVPASNGVSSVSAMTSRIESTGAIAALRPRPA